MIPWQIAVSGSAINAAAETGLLEAIATAQNTSEGYAAV
jgi:hypothetical protein